MELIKTLELEHYGILAVVFSAIIYSIFVLKREFKSERNESDIEESEE